MNPNDRIRLFATSIRRLAEDIQQDADFLSEPKPDDTEQMIEKINQAGWRLMLCQCMKLPFWYVCLYRGMETRTTNQMPSPTAALQAAVNEVCK